MQSLTHMHMYSSVHTPPPIYTWTHMCVHAHTHTYTHRCTEGMCCDMGGRRGGEKTEFKIICGIVCRGKSLWQLWRYGKNERCQKEETLIALEVREEWWWFLKSFCYCAGKNLVITECMIQHLQQVILGCMGAVWFWCLQCISCVVYVYTQ